MADSPVELTAYVINVRRDADRWRRVSARLAAIGVRAVRVEAVTPDDALVAGNAQSPAASCCALSHLRAWSQAEADGCPTPLIVEDDAVFSTDAAEVAGKSMRRLTEWDLFYLGACVLEHSPACEGVRRVRHGGHTHAYAIRLSTRTARLADWVRYDVRHVRGYWDWFVGAGARRYVAWPFLAIQEPGWSYNHDAIVDRRPEYFTSEERAEFEFRCPEARSWL